MYSFLVFLPLFRYSNLTPEHLLFVLSYILYRLLSMFSTLNALYEKYLVNILKSYRYGPLLFHEAIRNGSYEQPLSPSSTSRPASTISCVFNILHYLIQIAVISPTKKRHKSYRFHGLSLYRLFNNFLTKV